MSAARSLSHVCEENSPQNFWIKEHCEKVISKTGQLYSITEENFQVLETEGDYVIDQLGSFKEQGPDTAISRQQVKSIVTESAEIRETVASDYHKLNDSMQKYMEILTTEDEIRSIIMDIESSFSFLAQTMHQDLTTRSNEFRSVFAAREPRTRVSTEYFHKRKCENCDRVFSVSSPPADYFPPPPQSKL